jgi:hypothetical protein
MVKPSPKQLRTKEAIVLAVQSPKLVRPGTCWYSTASVDGEHCIIGQVLFDAGVSDADLHRARNFPFVYLPGYGAAHLMEAAEALRFDLRMLLHAGSCFDRYTYSHNGSFRREFIESYCEIPAINLAQRNTDMVIREAKQVIEIPTISMDKAHNERQFGFGF